MEFGIAPAEKGTGMITPSLDLNPPPPLFPQGSLLTEDRDEDEDEDEEGEGVSVSRDRFPLWPGVSFVGLPISVADSLRISSEWLELMIPMPEPTGIPRKRKRGPSQEDRFANPPFLKRTKL